MNKILPIINILGSLLMLFSLGFTLPLLVSYLYQDGAEWEFILGFLFTFGLGYLLWLTTRRFKRELKPKDGFILVFTIWTVIAAFATIPLLLHFQSLSFTDAYFETMSGLTTTGATVLSGLDTMPQSINFWRHWLNWIGGMGIIVLAVAILPLLGVGGMQLYKAETPGPMKDSKLTPRITETAKNLWLIYAAITIVCIVSLKTVGMDWFDAICHAFAAMALGGFSTHDASIGFFDSPAIEAVLIVFMLLAAMNFATHFLAWRQKNLKAYLQDPEARAMVILISLSIGSLAYYLYLTGTYPHFWTAFRYVAFNLVSLATDCGFVNTNYDTWPIFVPLWMLFLSCIAASSGSTGGGIKMIRSLILYKQSQREILTLLHPAAMNPLKVAGTAISNKVIFAVLGFTFLYAISIIILTFFLVASGLEFISAFSAIIACINNAGPGLHLVGPATNYAVLTDFQTWICTFAMFLGRLEIFSVIILFTPAFWRK